MGFPSTTIYNHIGRKDIVSGVLYNEFGQMTRISRGNGTDTYYDYDIKGRLQNLVTYTESNSQSRKLQDVHYGFRIDGSIASVTNTPDIDTQGGYHSATRYDYEYDGLSRLVKARGNYSRGSTPNNTVLQTVDRFERGFQYSPNGNMTAKNIFDPDTHGITDSRQYVYSGNNHAVTSIDLSSFGAERFSMQYDAAGNMTGQRDFEKNLAKQMAYDSNNRIVRVTNPDRGDELIGQYWYDDQGFRVRKLANREISGQQRMVEVLL